MKRVQYFHYGAPEELRLDDVTPPDAGRGQIRVQVRAAAANPMDWKIRRGEMKLLSGSWFPRGLGHHIATGGSGASILCTTSGMAAYGNF